MQIAVNILGTITVAVCALLLLRAYMRMKTQLLLWSGLCFTALTVSNGFVFYDLVVVPQVSLYSWRLATAALGMLLLVYGLVFESD